MPLRLQDVNNLLISELEELDKLKNQLRDKQIYIDKIRYVLHAIREHRGIELIDAVSDIYTKAIYKS